MKLHRYTWGVPAALAVLATAAFPVLAQDVNKATSSTTTTTTTTTTTMPATDQSTFNQPVAVPMGQGWYAAASTTQQDAFMSRGAPWGNDLTPVRGVARVAAIDGDTSPRGPGATVSTAPPATAGNNRLVTGVAQWIVPADNSTWEVRFTGINPQMPFGGVGVMREEHGDTGRDTSNFPRALSYIAVYGPVDVFRNGQRLATGLNGHIMVTQGIRLPDSGRLLDTPNVRPEDMQFHVLVSDPIPGTNMNSLYVFWPYSTLDLRNLSSPVALLPQELQVAQSYFTPTEAVAGFRGTEMVPAPQLLLVSLRDRFLARSDDVMPAGDVTIQVTNDSMDPQGFYIQGPGVDQRTNILNPGEQTTLRLSLQPGNYRIATFYPQGYVPVEMTGRRHHRRASTGGLMHWDTFTVQ